MAFDSTDDSTSPYYDGDPRGSGLSVPVVVAGAAGVVIAAWLGLKILGFALKVAGAIGTIAAVGGAIAYFVRRDNGDEEYE
jgi:hypothetical protein